MLQVIPIQESRRHTGYCSGGGDGGGGGGSGSSSSSGGGCASILTLPVVFFLPVFLS